MTRDAVKTHETVVLMVFEVSAGLEYISGENDKLKEARKQLKAATW